MHCANKSMKKNSQWVGGIINRRNYIAKRIKNHPSNPKQDYIFEHRLVMEKYLGRTLQSKEVVHHINGNTRDNRLENLQLLDISTHIRVHNGYKQIDGIWWKICRKCNILKEIIEFSRSKNFINAWCKSCHSINGKTRNDKYKDLICEETDCKNRVYGIDNISPTIKRYVCRKHYRMYVLGYSEYGVYRGRNKI